MKLSIESKTRPITQVDMFSNDLQKNQIEYGKISSKGVKSCLVQQIAARFGPQKS